MDISTTPSAEIADARPPRRLVKRTALTTFKLMRLAAAQATKVPGALAQAAADVREAWQESAKPQASDQPR